MIRSPLAATDAAYGGGLSLGKSRSSAIDLPEGSAEKDLGLDLEDALPCVWSSRNKAEEELAAALALAWARAVEVRGRAVGEPTWPEMPSVLEPAGMVSVPPMKEEHGPDGRAELAVDDREVVVISDDTSPRTDVVERAGVE